MQIKKDGQMPSFFRYSQQLIYYCIKSKCDLLVID